MSRAIIAIDPGPTESAYVLWDGAALQAFGLLTVLREAPPRVTPNGTKVRIVECRCVCGVEKLIRFSELTRSDGKRTISCGCYRAARNRTQKPPLMIIHGLTSRGGAHHLYTAWKGVKRRCYDKQGNSYELYGGRGIRMHDQWISDPAAFASYILTALGDRPTCQHTLDRIDNNGNYVPGNLRWATKKQQIENRRPSSEWNPWGTKTGRLAR